MNYRKKANAIVNIASKHKHYLPSSILEYILKFKLEDSLQGKVPLLGFSGGPFTLMAYMIEGGGSKTFLKTKNCLYNYPEES
jgi:uroporphyrinogen decarboxylase